jgi:RecQ family ATP-dependent DNA helicase
VISYNITFFITRKFFVIHFANSLSLTTSLPSHLIMDEYELLKFKTVRYNKCKQLLKDYYGYNEFKPHQYEVINKTMNGQDILAIFPTGYGKSVCYTMQSIYTRKITIVISPLISLMQDQCKKLDDIGIKSCFYSLQNTTSKQELTRQILELVYLFIYVAPESLSGLLPTIQLLNEHNLICLVAVDEAHCISLHGLDFREDYRTLGIIRQYAPGVPLLAMTATATTSAIRDISNILGLNIIDLYAKPSTEISIINSQLVRVPFDRPNLFIKVNKLLGTDKKKEMPYLFNDLD